MLMNIIQIVDTEKSAIAILARQIKRHNPDLNIKTAAFHPKKPDKNQIDNVHNLLKWADIIDCQYWKSGNKVKEMMPELWHSKPKMLTHYNPYNLHEQKWTEYKKVVVVNNYQKSELPQAELIPLAIDQKFFTFNKDYCQQPVVNMTIARIESKKGCLEVAEACNQLKYLFILVGRISDDSYFKKTIAAGGKFINYRGNINDPLVRSSYYESAIHVCNSIDGFESGTMPVLEAMSCGVPVVSRLVGHVPDIYNGNNMVIHEGKQEDIEGIKTILKTLMEDKDKRLKMRALAAESIKGRTDIWRAGEYANAYKKVMI